MNYSEINFSDTFSVQEQNNAPQVNAPQLNTVANNQQPPAVNNQPPQVNNTPPPPVNNNMNMDNRNVQQLPSMNRLDSLYNKPSPKTVVEPVEEPPKTNNVKLIQLGVILMFSFLTALSWNEAIRYYIGRSIKFYSGKPIFYVYYASTATFLMCLSYLYSYLK